MELIACNSNVIIKKDEVKEVTTSGLYLPSEAIKEVSVKSGIVKYVGPEVDLEVGSHVFYKQYSESEIEVEGEKFIVVSIEDILAILVV